MTDDAAKKSEKMPHVSIRSEPIPSSSQKSSPVQTIHDSSTAPLPQPPPTTIALKRPKSSAKRARKEVDEDEVFRDSRGYGPSQCHP